MARKLSATNIHNIAIGASLFGAGGGGDPYIGELMAISAVERFGPVTLVSPEEIADDALFLSICNIGAPSILTEKFPKGTEPSMIFNKMSHYLGQPLAGTYPIEAGGVNSMLPIVLAAQKQIPLVDVDGMGRAFPEVEMTTFAINGVAPTPMAIADERGNFHILETATPKWAERLGRDSVVEMGGTASAAEYPVTGRQLKSYGIHGIITLCEQIGELITGASSNNGDSLGKLLTLTHGYHLFDGKVIDVTRFIRKGFNFGTVRFEGIKNDAGQELEVDFQNENLVARRNEKLIASVPDLISFCDYDTLKPATAESIKFGKRLKVLGIPADLKWRTAQGLQAVGPRFFGYNFDYASLEHLQINKKEGL